MATLYVNRNDSRCGECGKSAMPYQTVHDERFGYNPGPGCGAVFTQIDSDYVGIYMQEWAEKNRPDLEWVGLDERKLREDYRKSHGEVS